MTFPHMEYRLPSSWLAVSIFPCPINPRMRVLETALPFIMTGGTTSTEKQNRFPSAFRRAVFPAPPDPNAWLFPLTKPDMGNPLANFSIKASALVRAKARVNGTTTTASTPRSFKIRSFSSMGVMRGTRFGEDRTTCWGWGSKVTSTLFACSEQARSTRRPRIARCPR